MLAFVVCIIQYGSFRRSYFYDGDIRFWFFHCGRFRRLNFYNVHHIFVMVFFDVGILMTVHFVDGNLTMIVFNVGILSMVAFDAGILRW